MRRTYRWEVGEKKEATREGSTMEELFWMVGQGGNGFMERAHDRCSMGKSHCGGVYGTMKEEVHREETRRHTWMRRGGMIGSGASAF